MRKTTASILSACMLVASTTALAANDMKMDTTGKDTPKECIKKDAAGKDQVDKDCMKRQADKNPSSTDSMKKDAPQTTPNY